MRGEQTVTPASAYRDFWAGVGERFPDLAGAASTRYYADNERRLFTEHFPALEGLRILKTDLWDEAKNTRILAWASRQGARAYGIDISEPTVIQARAAFDTGPGARHCLQGAVGDVRDLPFRDASFDAIYSMGTIEHFDETERAVEEMARVLKPGGRAIVGVPNRHDPFLRPLLATALQAVGLYGVRLREVLLTPRAESRCSNGPGSTWSPKRRSCSFPGGCRMLDLACHSWCRPLAAVTGAARAAVRVPRSPRAGRAEARLPAGDRRHEAGTVTIPIAGVRPTFAPIVVPGATAGRQAERQRFATPSSPSLAAMSSADVAGLISLSIARILPSLPM